MELFTKNINARLGWTINCRIYKQNFCLLSPAWSFSTNAEFLYHWLNEVDFKSRTVFPVSVMVFFSLFSLPSMCEAPINCFPFPPTPCNPFRYFVWNWVRGCRSTLPTCLLTTMEYEDAVQFQAFFPPNPITQLLTIKLILLIYFSSERRRGLAWK